MKPVGETLQVSPCPRRSSVQPLTHAQVFGASQTRMAIPVLEAGRRVASVQSSCGKLGAPRERLNCGSAPGEGEGLGRVEKAPSLRGGSEVPCSSVSTPVPASAVRTCQGMKMATGRMEMYKCNENRYGSGFPVVRNSSGRCQGDADKP